MNDSNPEIIDIEMPLVSIIMPVFNSEKKISTAIKSVMNQLYDNWELILINDGSADESIEIMKTYSELDDRIKVVDRQINKGISYSRNEGIKISRGEYIAFLDSDDEWEKNKLLKHLKKMISVDAVFSCTSYIIKSTDNKHKISEKAEGYYGYKDLLKTNFIGCLTVIVKREIIMKNLMPEIKHEDYATWLNILNENNEIYYFNECLSIYNKSKGSVSSNKFRSLIWSFKVINSQVNLSFFSKQVFKMNYLFHTLIKLLKITQNKI